MNKYFLSLGGFAIVIFLIGAGCTTTAPISTPAEDTIVPDESHMQEADMLDTSSDTDMVEADIVIHLTGKNFAFSQQEIRVTEGDVVTINFESEEGYHDWVVDEFDAATDKVNAGSNTSVTFTADKIGEYEYYCSVGNHRAQGMVGKLIVEAVREVGTYTEYNETKLTMAETGDVVLFFHATWCPSCKALDNAINKDIESIPGNLTILKVDYDNATELKKKYGVTTQHTLVQVDADGNMIQKKLGGNRLSDITGWVK